MSGTGRMSGPGGLSGPGTLSSGTPLGEITPLPAEPLSELAAEHGLRPSARRPPLRAYIRQIWHGGTSS